MTATLTPQLLAQLKTLWDVTRARASLEWSPVLLYCGPCDDDVKGFPVKSEDGDHHLWVPQECRFGLRLMNHVSYCVWQLSRSPALPYDLRRYAAVVAQYTEAMRSRFFDEVLRYWYPAGAQLPTLTRPNTRSRPLESQYLTSFLVTLFCDDTPIPPDVWPTESHMTDPAKFNWEEWAQRKPANRILLGSPNDMPSLEIDKSSWHQYTSAVVEEYMRKILGRMDASDSEHQTGLERRDEDTQGQQLDPNELDANTLGTPGSLDNSAGKTIERSRGSHEGYMLELNQTRLLFIPSLGQADVSKPTLGGVVQVSLRGDYGNGGCIAKNASTEQVSITRTIETLLVGHVTGLHVLPQCVTIEEVVPGYTLTGVRKPWRYGLGKKFFHGDSIVRPAQDKWVFYLENSD